MATRWVLAAAALFHVGQGQADLYLYDCKVDKGTWQTTWSGAKKDYCWKHQDGPTAEPWCCDQDLPNMQAWVAAKKQYCCDLKGVGCRGGGTTTTPFNNLPFDCAAGFDNWEAGWSIEKKNWCCTNKGVACHKWDCNRGSPFSWPQEKKEYCCTKTGQNCPTTTTPIPFDCNAGLAKWESGWSAEKKQYCCALVHLGCDPWDCDEGNWDTWRPEKKGWCCANKGKACGTTTTAHRFDCNAGLANWEAGWSAEKKAYCCPTHGFACDPWNCEEGNWHTWGPAKKGWCCANKGKACPTTTTAWPTTTTPIPFDCNAGVANWEAGWSPEKKQYCCALTHTGCDPWNCDEGNVHTWGPEKKGWCCANKGKACLGPITTTPNKFDCNAGLANWEAGWAPEKKQWCCTVAHVACDPWNCDEGSWHTWSPEKKGWCCANEGKGCTATTSPAFDCAAGLANWEAGWSAEKQQWCCTSQAKGCSGVAPQSEAGSGGTMDMNMSGETNLTNFTNMSWAEPEAYVTEPTEWWMNVTGNCTTIGYCVQSPNYPQKYGNDQGCNITLNQSVRPRVTGMMFSAESNYDVLTVNGQKYSGTTGPVSVVPTSTITWSSDHVNQGHGWQLCFQERDIVLTMTTTPKPMVYDGCPVNVFAQFFPENTEMLKDRPFQRFLKKDEEPFDSFAQVPRGRDESVFLEILVTEKANTGNEELPVAMEIIRRTQGDLFVALKNAMRRFVDFKPIVGGMYLNWVVLKPYHVDTCEAKMSKLVREFSRSYTRRLVPWALYNECTNFMTAMSFSHDPLVNELDRSKCRAWTHNFMQKWNYGKGVKEVADPNLFDCQAGLANSEEGWSSDKKCWCCAHESQGCDPGITCPKTWAVNRTAHIDYKCWCQGVCESKFGVGAPVCHITSGAKNFYQPV